MGGETEHLGGPGAGGEQAPAPFEAPRFRRGLDGRIYHYPPLRERIAGLRGRFRNALRAVSVIATLPVTGILTTICLSIGIPPFGMFWTALLLLLAFSIIFGVGVFFLVQSLFESKLRRRHDQVLYWLLTTDLPVLLADESSWLRVREQAERVPQLRWLGIPMLGKFEETLLFGAAYLDVLEGFASSPQPASPHKLRHGSCLSWLTTAPASGLGWTAACGCATPWLNTLLWFALFPLIVGTNRYIELAGNLTAICDYFLSSTDELEAERFRVEEALLTRPNRLRPLPGTDTLADIQRRSGDLHRQ